MYDKNEKGYLYNCHIEPKDDDAQRIKMLREIVFQWVWQASQYGD